MNYIDSLSQSIALIACLLLFLAAEPALNHCKFGQTRWSVFLGLFCFAAGALLTLAAIIPGILTSAWPGTALLACGSVLLLRADRRRIFRS